MEHGYLLQNWKYLLLSLELWVVLFLLVDPLYPTLLYPCNFGGEFSKTTEISLIICVSVSFIAKLIQSFSTEINNLTPCKGIGLDTTNNNEAM